MTMEFNQQEILEFKQNLFRPLYNNKYDPFANNIIEKPDNLPDVFRGISTMDYARKAKSLTYLLQLFESDIDNSLFLHRGKVLSLCIDLFLNEVKGKPKLNDTQASFCKHLLHVFSSMGRFNCSISDIRNMLLPFRYDNHLLLNEDAAKMYFDSIREIIHGIPHPPLYIYFSGKGEPIHVPPVNIFPTNGFTKCVRFCLAALSSFPMGRNCSNLFSINGETEGNSVSIGITNKDILVQYVIKKKVTDLVFREVVDLNKWYYLTLTHSHGNLKKSVVDIYLNKTSLYSDKCPYPESMKNYRCEIGGGMVGEDILGADYGFKGSMSIVFFEEGSKTPNEVAIYNDFPQEKLNHYVAPNSIFVYDPRFQESSSLLLDGSPNALSAYLPAGTKIIRTEEGKTSFWRVGGVELLLPLCVPDIDKFAISGIPVKAPCCSVPPKGLSSIISLIASLVSNDRNNVSLLETNNTIYYLQTILKYIDEKYITMELFMAIKALCSSLFVSPRLFTSTYKNILFNLEIWRKAPFDIQMLVIEWYKQLFSVNKHIPSSEDEEIPANIDALSALPPKEILFTDFMPARQFLTYLTSLYIDEKTEYNRKYPSLSTKELSLLRTNILSLYVLIYTKDNIIKPECITDLYAYLAANECQSIGSRYIYTILNRSISIPLSIQEYDTIINFSLSSNDRTSCTIKFPWLLFYIWKQLLISPCSLRLKHLNLIASLFTGDHAEENFKQSSSIPCFYIYIFTLSHITSTSSESNSRGNESGNHRTLYDYNNIIINNRNDLEKKKEAIECLFALNTEESQGLLIKYFKDPQINEDIRDYILDIMAIKNADDVMSMLLEKCIVIHGYYIYRYIELDKFDQVLLNYYSYLNNHIYSIPSLMIYIQLLNHLCKNLKENLSKMKMSPIIANNIKSLTQYICYIFKKNDIFNASIFTSLSDIYIYITSYITAKDNYNTEFTVPEDKFVISLKTSILHPCGSLHDYLTLCLCKMTFNMKNNIHNDTAILDTIIYIIQRMELSASSTTNNASTPAVIPVIGRNEGEQLFISFLLFSLNEYRNFYSSKNHQMGPYIYKHMNSLLRSPVGNEQDMNTLVHSDTIMNNVNIYNQYTAIYLARMEKYIDLYIEHFEKATKKIEQTITSSTLPTLSPSTQTNNDVYFRSREQEKDKLYIYKLLELLTYIYYTNILYKQNSWEYRSLSSHGNINGTHLIEDLNFGGKNYEDHARRGKSIKEKEKDDYMKKIQGLLNKVQSKKQNELDDDHDAEDDELEALQEAVPSILSIYEARYREENQDSNDVPRSPASRPLSGGLKGLFGKKKKEVLSPVPTSPITHTYTFSVSSLSFDTILPSLDSLHFYTLQEFSNHMQTNGQEKEQIPMDLEENNIVYSSPSKYIYMSFEVIGTIYINKNQLEFEGTSIRHLGSSSEKTLPSYMSSLSKQLLIKQSFSLALVTYIFRRKYLYQDIAIEFYFADGSSIYLVMNDNQEREDFYYTVKKYTSVRLFRSPINKRLYPSSSLLSSLPITQKWVDRQITTYDYLIALNIFAGRSFNNLAQYPVFPWIFKDYTSATLDLSNPNVYRDLSKPIGALNPDRLESFKERYEVMKEMYASDDGSSVNSVPFLYGTHYSSAGYTLFYLVREEPYTLLHIYLQSGVFDEAERLFTSVEGCFQSAMNSNGDVKELTPEWYYLPSFLVNQNKLPLGTKQDGTVINNVILPPWASSPEQFIYFQREGLESTYTDMHIAQWIDLIFGYKQKGVAAEESDNIFFSLTYEDNVNVDSLMNPLDKEAVLIQVAEFGQCPSQLFTTQHPSRVELPLAPTSPATVSTVSLFSPLKEDVVSIYINSKTKHLYGIDRSGKICDYIYKYDGMNDIKSNVYLATEDRKKAIQEHKFVTMYSTPHFIPVDNKHTYILQTGYVDNSMRITAVNSMFSKDNSVKDMILYNNTDIVTCASIDRDIDFLTSSEGSDIYMVVGSNDCSLSLYIYPGTYTGILSSLYNINNYTPLLQSPLCVKYIDSPVNGVDLCCKLDIFAGVGDNSKLYLYTIKEMEFLREIDINDSKKQIEELFGHSIKSLYIQKVKLVERGYIILYIEVVYKHKHRHILMNYHINGNFLNVVRLEEDEEDVMTDLCINMKGNKIITADMRGIVIRDVFSLQVQTILSLPVTEVSTIYLPPEENVILIGSQKGEIIIVPITPEYLN
ncbi:hypothetical protein WA158_003848 [Blastocystis sp. Blastoise]